MDLFMSWGDGQLTFPTSSPLWSQRLSSDSYYIFFFFLFFKGQKFVPRAQVQALHGSHLPALLCNWKKLLVNCWASPHWVFFMPQFLLKKKNTYLLSSYFEMKVNSLGFLLESAFLFIATWLNKCFVFGDTQQLLSFSELKTIHFRYF